MVQTPDITRPPKAIIDGLREVGSATTSGVLCQAWLPQSTS